MTWLQAAGAGRAAGLSLLTAAALAGCANAPNLNPMAAADVTQNSTVAADVTAARHIQGSYPHFSQVPVIPTDVRAVPAWREAVVTEWNQKRKTEREAAALKFTLANTEEWAQRTRAKIPSGQTTPPALDTADRIEAFATTERARATPPPPPQ
jgi:hypothetical protein